MNSHRFQITVDHEVKRLAARLQSNGHLDPPQRLFIRGKRAIHRNKYSYTEDQRQQMETAPGWKALKDQLFALRGCKCENCWRTYQVVPHHRYYFYDRKPWEYELEDFLLLCRICHTIVHNRIDETVRIICRDAAMQHERELREQFQAEETAWEVNQALGFYSDPTLSYDEDNAAEWEEDHGADIGDMLEQRQLDAEGDYDDEHDGGYGDYDDDDDAT